MKRSRELVAIQRKEMRISVPKPISKLTYIFKRNRDNKLFFIYQITLLQLSIVVNSQKNSTGF